MIPPNPISATPQMAPQSPASAPGSGQMGASTRPRPRFIDSILMKNQDKKMQQASVLNDILSPAQNAGPGLGPQMMGFGRGGM